MYLIVSTQYVSSAMAFSIGGLYRKPVYRNVPFCINIILATLLNYYVVLCPHQGIKNILNVSYKVTGS